jgi:hypothetical protein
MLGFFKVLKYGHCLQKPTIKKNVYMTKITALKKKKKSRGKSFTSKATRKCCTPEIGSLGGFNKR